MFSDVQVGPTVGILIGALALFVYLVRQPGGSEEVMENFWARVEHGMDALIGMVLAGVVMGAGMALFVGLLVQSWNMGGVVVVVVVFVFGFLCGVAVWACQD